MFPAVVSDCLAASGREQAPGKPAGGLAQISFRLSTFDCFPELFRAFSRILIRNRLSHLTEDAHAPSLPHCLDTRRTNPGHARHRVAGTRGRLVEDLQTFRPAESSRH